MKPSVLPKILAIGLLSLVITTARAAEEQDLIATLRSNATAPQKWAAAQRLRIVGTPESIPALAELLPDDRLSQAARHALEALPYPEAGAALRNALANTSGLIKAGIIESIGWRHDAGAVPLLRPLLSDRDNAVAESAAVALGRIGGAEAATALTAVLSQNLPGVEEALLRAAEQLTSANERYAAGDVYRALLRANLPVQTRVAAWRGLASDPGQQKELVLAALSSKDRPIQLAALRLLHEISDPNVVQAAAKQWESLPPESQLAVLDAQMKLGAEALPTARLAGASPDATLRTAGWAALGELNDIQAIPALAKAAASGQPAEREAARESLARLRGSTARDALVAALDKASPAEQAELLRAFGDRGDRGATDLLIRYAGMTEASVRLAALESITRLSPPAAIAPLLDIAAKSKSDAEREPVLKALYAICEASPSKTDAARNVVQALGRFPASERRQVLPLLSELATPDALAAAEAASHDADPALAKDAVRVLGQWPSAAPAGHLLELARTSPDQTLQTLALRGAIEVAGQESDADKRLTLLKQAFGTAKNTEEKKQALGQIGGVPTSAALSIAEQHLKDPELSAEAALAAVSIAEKLATTDPKLGDRVATQVLDQVKEGDVARRAWALRLKPSSAESFLRDWVVAGPYRQAGIAGAQAVFVLPFGPEKDGQSVEWRTVPPADHVNLAALFPGAENCVAYLRTRIVASDETRGALLMSSDDGLKAWLNGAVVHSKNVDRGETVDQDTAPIRLKQGANELILKVSQGGGGWSVSARVVGTDGKPIRGLLVERPTQAAGPLAASK